MIFGARMTTPEQKEAKLQRAWEYFSARVSMAIGVLFGAWAYASGGWSLALWTFGILLIVAFGLAFYQIWRILDNPD